MHSSFDGYLSYFYLLAVKNDASMKTQARIFVWTYVFNTLSVDLLSYMRFCVYLFFLT
jgi:hypothetical protein